MRCRNIFGQDCTLITMVNRLPNMMMAWNASTHTTAFMPPCRKKYQNFLLTVNWCNCLCISHCNEIFFYYQRESYLTWMQIWPSKKYITIFFLISRIERLYIELSNDFLFFWDNALDGQNRFLLAMHIYKQTGNPNRSVQCMHH